MKQWTEASMKIMTEGIFRVLQTAQVDLKKIVQYIAADSEAKAKEVYIAIKEKAENLWVMPSRGRVVPELSSLGISSYREHTSPPWRVIYKIDEGRVWVLAVIDGRRNMEDTLLERLI